MPELPEVETVVRALGRELPGRFVARIRLLGRMRVPFSAPAATAALQGRQVTGVRRRAKYIILTFDGPHAILSHLGMTGFFHITAKGQQYGKHDRAAIAFSDGSRLCFSDARRFGFCKVVTLDCPTAFPAELASLGPEPLERSLTGAYLHSAATGRKVAVKPFIMDQTVVVGVGNIYAAEALHASGIDPRRPAGTLTRAEWDRLAREIKTVLRAAIRRGGSTIDNYRSVDGSEGKFQLTLQVYGRQGEKCGRCGASVACVRLGGRSTFWCPGCQG